MQKKFDHDYDMILGRETFERMMLYSPERASIIESGIKDGTLTPMLIYRKAISGGKANEFALRDKLVGMYCSYELEESKKVK